MAEAAEVIAVDTNLLVYAHRSSLSEHRRALRALETACQSPKGWGIPLPCLAEFWSVVTHPACAGGPSTAAEAREFLRVLVAEAGADVWTPQTGFWDRLARLASDLGIAGARIFDLQIALTAFENGASEIWTHDQNFATLPGLPVRDPM